jgi:hypothetical protein
VIGFIPGDWEFRSEDAWFAEAWLPQEDFNTVLAAYRSGEINRLRFGPELDAWIYEGDEHTPPGWGTTWHLAPSQEHESQFPENAYGEVVYLGWGDKDDTGPAVSDTTRASARAEQIRKSRLDAQIGQWFEDRDPKHGRSSEYARALNAISRAALEHARASDAPLSGGKNSFEELLEGGFDAVPDRLRRGLQPHDQPDDEKRELKLWSHRHAPVYDTKRNKTPSFQRSEIESAVGDYLALPYRDTQIDRLIADILIAMELYGFSDETSHSDYDTLMFILSGQKWKVQLTELLLLVGLVFLLQRLNLISDRWAGLGYIMAVVLSQIGFLARWRKRAAANALIKEMLYCYAELNSDGPISARRLRERLEAAAEKGVVWPAPLYALIDDVLTRTGRL